MSEDGSGRQGASSAAVPASPLEDDNLLSLILHRLPAVPSSLLRASLVCKGWRSLVSDPRFLRDFRTYHKNSPLLGFFSGDLLGNVEFTTMLGSSDCIPASRFSLCLRPGSRVLCSHHGRILILDQEEQQFLVWDPVTGELGNIAFPPAFHGKMLFIIDGGIVCAATDQGHVHGACHSDPFRLVFLGEDRERILACAYSSETRAWGNLFSIMRPPYFVRYNSPKCPSTLSRNSISLLLFGDKAVILEFDWGKGNLALIDVPSDAYDFDAFIGGMCQFMIAHVDSGGLCFYLLSAFSVHVWKRVCNSDGIATWMLEDTIELRNLLSLKPTMHLTILGLDEDNKVILKLTDSVVFMVSLESMQFKTLSTQLPFYSFSFHPFKSFYTPGMRVSAGHNVAQSLQGT